jgi:hypothetical protein
VNAHHSLVLVHRGREHRHPHEPHCACGWFGVPRRRRQDAELEYREHRHNREKCQHVVFLPLPLTPVDRLPDVLRVAV